MQQVTACLAHLREHGVILRLLLSQSSSPGQCAFILATKGSLQHTHSGRYVPQLPPLLVTSPLRDQIQTISTKYPNLTLDLPSAELAKHWTRLTHSSTDQLQSTLSRFTLLVGPNHCCGVSVQIINVKKHQAGVYEIIKTPVINNYYSRTPHNWSLRDRA